MTETTILDDRAVSEIEAQITSGDSQVMYETANVDNVRSLCATVNHLRAEVRGIRRGFPEWAAEWDALQSQLEQLRAENGRLKPEYQIAVRFLSRQGFQRCDGHCDSWHEKLTP